MNAPLQSLQPAPAGHTAEAEAPPIRPLGQTALRAVRGGAPSLRGRTLVRARTPWRAQRRCLHQRSRRAISPTPQHSLGAVNQTEALISRRFSTRSERRVAVGPLQRLEVDAVRRSRADQPLGLVPELRRDGDREAPFLTSGPLPDPPSAARGTNPPPPPPAPPPTPAAAGSPRSAPAFAPPPPVESPAPSTCRAPGTPGFHTGPWPGSPSRAQGQVGLPHLR